MINIRQELALRSHDITIGLGNKQVPEFELLTEIGNMIKLALNIRGLPIIPYTTLKLAAYHFLDIPTYMCSSIVENLAEIEFVKITSEGKTIKAVLPTVPFYEDIYEGVGEFAETKQINETEQLAVTILKKLTASPVSSSTIYELGAEKKLVERNLSIGKQGNYIINKRSRGKDILLSPVYFSENADLFSDLVAKSGAKTVQKILTLIKKAQGIPLHIIEQRKEINGVKLTDPEINLLKSLAYDSIIKPPSIKTSHAGENYFLFTPKPGNARLSPTKREIYERAMALVSAVRQGQYLPKKYAIRNPHAILRKLKNDHEIGANTEALEQYRQLTVLKVGNLVSTPAGWHKFVLINTEENIEAVSLALDLVSMGEGQGLEVDDQMRLAISHGQTYVESLISANKLKESENVALSEEHQEEVDNIFIGGV
ncbi:hypothetical protein MOC46_10520 [Bacillus spizizenii]|uniref:hypothetical protein n=1 Tax=Bacillus subtilis group TaxID=653685 RepID=UPI000C2A1DE2|nr:MULTISPECIES: hypothetical protein [Bacillus subtilis group]MCY8188103.1 hypothetical protein [Bacillus spizizenii]MBU8678817.1 hypothetical protein [Bacillus subtilis]MCY8395618.1 hypothetical protein [Bacillus spizizenii]MXV40863.1 hypothetical protein [Bacillus subtilis]PJZ00648.1 hypothetical protein CPT06_08755 [Bacillus vallismortis]